MKYLALLALLVTGTTQAQVKLDCEAIKEDAKYAMIARQVNEPIERPLRFFRPDIVRHAFEKPIEEGYGKQIAVDVFSEMYFEACLKENERGR